MAALLPYCLIILLFFPLPSPAQNTSAGIPIGASLTAAENSNSWRSPSGDFAFGFLQLPGNKDLFLLSIWFDKIPNKTIVWYENGSYPVPPSSTVRLDTEEGIVLRDPQNKLLYRSNFLNSRVANGFMNDTGNFVLQSEDSTSLWESFKNPTDTILPTPTIEINGELISRVTPTNFSQGRFYARMMKDGNFLLSTKSFPKNDEFDEDYYTTATSDANVSNSGVQLVFDENSLLSVMRQNGERSPLTVPGTIPSASDNYYRATLDFDGVFVQYYHPKNLSGNPKWEMAISWPDNICASILGQTGSGACGYNSVCRTEKKRPVCECPQWFSLVDPNNAYGDCKPNYVQQCIERDQPGSPNDKFEILEIPEVDWSGNDYMPLSPSTEEQCRSLCMNDCFCGAAIYRRPGKCWTKRLPLSNGRVVDASLGITAFLKYGKGDNNASSVNPTRPSLSNPKRDRTQRTLILVLSVVLGISFLIITLLIAAGCLGFNPIYSQKSHTPIPTEDTLGSNLRCFTYKELVQATNRFNEELGRGSFGIVYKGAITNCSSSSIVAVKKLDRVAQDSEKEFRAEVNVIGQTHHKNLVQLIGFCDEGPHRLLVYEYMSNGTLAEYLFRDVRPSWFQRMQIALGVARGLTYLHDECRTQIIHCDIKPQNILLDEFYNACISDFGLAKTLMMNQSRTHTNIRGTKGYVAPEWFRNTQVTAKVDVYSFGVLLLEIITCKKSVNPSVELEDEEDPILTDWVWDCFIERRIDSLVDNDKEALGDRKTLERFVMTGIWCIQEDRSMRPTMRKAYQMLEGVVEVGVPPCPFHFTSTA